MERMMIEHELKVKGNIVHFCENRWYLEELRNRYPSVKIFSMYSENDTFIDRTVTSETYDTDHIIDLSILKTFNPKHTENFIYKNIEDILDRFIMSAVEECFLFSFTCKVLFNKNEDYVMRFSLRGKCL